MTTGGMSQARPVVVVSRFLPDPLGFAASRILDAFVRGARALGRDVVVWSWWPYDPPAELPDWVRWDRLPAEPLWRTKGRALVRPRHDVTIVGWDVPDDVIAVAEDSLSFPAVRHHARSVLTMHYSTALDRRALGSIRAKDVQDLRFERLITRQATLPTALSERVARQMGCNTRAVPVALQIPSSPLPVVDAPVATCIADWSWPPNRTALDRLLAAWPLVREQLPTAELVLAGHGDTDVGSVAGVRVLGRVPDSSEVLAQAAALVFPTADTSGPKVKVMEAMSLGLPVVTTTAGVEGLAVSPQAARLVEQPAAAPQLAAAIVATLRDPAARSRQAEVARAEFAAAHAPEPAARARLRVIDEGLAAT